MRVENDLNSLGVKNGWLPMKNSGSRSSLNRLAEKFSDEVGANRSFDYLTLPLGTSNYQYYRNAVSYGGRRQKSWTCASTALTLLSEDDPISKVSRGQQARYAHCPGNLSGGLLSEVSAQKSWRSGLLMSPSGLA